MTGWTSWLVVVCSPVQDCACCWPADWSAFPWDALASGRACSRARTVRDRSAPLRQGRATGRRRCVRQPCRASIQVEGHRFGALSHLLVVRALLLRTLLLGEPCWAPCWPMPCRPGIWSCGIGTRMNCCWPLAASPCGTRMTCWAAAPLPIQRRAPAAVRAHSNASEHTPLSTGDAARSVGKPSQAADADRD